MTHVEQLERETEQARADIAGTLDELRACMTPGHVLDQLADRMNAGAPVAFARNLRDQTVNNPLPVALIGTGLAWLMLGRRGPEASDMSEAAGRASRVGREAVEGAVESVGQTASEAQAHLRETAGAMTDAVQQGAAQTADSLRGTADSARQTASQAADAIRGGAGAITDSLQRTAAATKAAGQRTLQSGGALVDFCREQPLVLAGVGLAMGAIIGALLPATDAENRVMGQTSDRAKEGMREFASQQVEAVKEGAKEGAKALKEGPNEAVKQGAKQGADQASEGMFDTSQEESAHPDVAHLATGERKKTADWKDDAKEGSPEPSADEPTLAPKGPDEAKGQPWSPENAPL
ncbi:DUF3618 domain-containing protein [Bradyrhizobium sp.]|uniref:DUF3618 domain-containing protein n=1 Tax=Bradyrhizobium sp. TaxID=376 RepID=UPI001EC89A94|nr:DUF3618 domain-containing protein [Bradyrhizobium sp.]MBV9980866.1 DUF3618 domain-containing protein [Bradyrhizobium sp.]